MIKDYSEDIYQQLSVAMSDGNAEKRRRIISQHLVIDEDMDMNMQRDIIVDVLYAATDFTMRNNFNFPSTAALIDIVALEFTSLMDPHYDFSLSSSVVIQEMKQTFMEKIQNGNHLVDLKTWTQIAEYIATTVLPQREAYHYMLHNMPIVIDKTVALCVDTPLRVHLPLSHASN